MAATISITCPTHTQTPSTAMMNLDCTSYTCSTIDRTKKNNPVNNNNNTYLDDLGSSQFLGDSEVLRALSAPIELPQGYLSISSVTNRRTSGDSEALGTPPSPKLEADLWPPSFRVFSKKERKISYAQEALPDDAFVSSKETPVRGGLIPSLPSISLPKLPERSWVCSTCRKPRDECHCLCTVS